MYSTVPTQPYNAILTYSKDINHTYNYHKTAIQWWKQKKWKEVNSTVVVILWYYCRCVYNLYIFSIFCIHDYTVQLYMKVNILQAHLVCTICKMLLILACDRNNTIVEYGARRQVLYKRCICDIFSRLVRAATYCVCVCALL